MKYVLMESNTPEYTGGLDEVLGYISGNYSLDEYHKLQIFELGKEFSPSLRLMEKDFAEEAVF